MVYFLDLPIIAIIALTPTYHIRKAPNSMKITQLFNPIAHKRKLQKGEESEGKTGLEPNEINKEAPSPKRNRKTSQ